ncbi:hypothetical protein [Streptomyces sp. NPDC001450]
MALADETVLAGANEDLGELGQVVMSWRGDLSPKTGELPAYTPPVW